MSLDTQEFDFNVDLLRAILWQYDNAANLRGILEQKKEWYDTNVSEFWNDWITNVFDLRTANEFGLAVWSIILGQSIFTSFVQGVTGVYWGFGAYNKNFMNGNFASVSGTTNLYTPTTARMLLRLRYFQLTSAGTVPETNRMLKYLFEEEYGRAYLVDNLDMTQTYNFEFAMPLEMSYMLNNTDILPRPAGVKNFIVTL